MQDLANTSNEGTPTATDVLERWGEAMSIASRTLARDFCCGKQGKTAGARDIRAHALVHGWAW